MKKLLPLVIAVIGLSVGTVAGLFLSPNSSETTTDGASEKNQPSSPEETAKAGEKKDAPSPHGPSSSSNQRRSEKTGTGQDGGYEYVKLNNQFVVPVVAGAKVTALVVMSLSIEVKAGKKEVVFGREPKLRDAFLQVLFDHANSGGFDGIFTAGEKMNDLRGSLFEVASRILGPIATDVLVIDIVRQDV